MTSSADHAPAPVLYGEQTRLAVANLTVSGQAFGRERAFVAAFGQIKLAAALANAELGTLDAPRAEAIAAACRELIDGQHDEQLVVDLMEGSGGTSTNMNVNEVLAARASRIAGIAVHPNDHVNRSQSTNDVYPSAMKLATLHLLEPTLAALQRLVRAWANQAERHADTLRLGRTCLQDAQPMLLGQAFGAYAALLARQQQALAAAREGLRALPLGGTAIGTGFGAPPGWRDAVLRRLCTITGVELHAAGDAFDAMQNLDAFARVSAELRHASGSMARIASDLILLASGPAGGIAELKLPSLQAGSSIMPGKVNPVLPMSVVQVALAVAGNDATIAQAHQTGQLEINHFEPVVAARLFDSIRLVTRAAEGFAERCVDGLEVDADACERHLLASSALATALLPTLGYDGAAHWVREALDQGRPLLDLLLERGVLTRAQVLDQLRDAARGGRATA